MGVYGKVVVSRQCGCIWAKVFSNRAKWFLSGKVVVFLKRRLYSNKSGCIQAKGFVIGQSGCIRAKRCVRAKVVVLV